MPADADTVPKQPEGDVTRVPDHEVPVDRRSLSSTFLSTTERRLVCSRDRTLSVGSSLESLGKMLPPCYKTMQV